MSTIPTPSAAQTDADCIAAAAAMLQRAADITLKVAEHIAQQILQEPASNPESSTGAAKPAARKRPDNRMVFDRLIRSLTAIMALKTRIATCRPAPGPAAARTQPRPPGDSRRPFISAYLDDAIEGMPHAVPADLRRRIDRRLDEHLAADPDQKLAGGEIILHLSDEYRIPFDLSRMTDDLLVPPGQSTPNGYKVNGARQQADPAPS